VTVQLDADQYFDKVIEHFFSELRKKYSIAVDETGSTYLGLTINWEYNKGYVEISVSDNVPKALAKFNHKLPPCPQHPQHPPHHLWTQPVYGQKNAVWS